MKSKTETVTTLTTGEAARICGVSANTITGWCERDGLPHYRKPGRAARRIPIAGFVRWLEENGLTMMPGIGDLDALREPDGSVRAIPAWWIGK